MKGKHFSILREVFSQVVKKVSSLQPIFVSEQIHNVSLATLDDEFATVVNYPPLNVLMDGLLG